MYKLKLDLSYFSHCGLLCWVAHWFQLYNLHSKLEDRLRVHLNIIVLTTCTIFQHLAVHLYNSYLLFYDDVKFACIVNCTLPVKVLENVG